MGRYILSRKGIELLCKGNCPFLLLFNRLPETHDNLFAHDRIRINSVAVKAERRYRSADHRRMFGMNQSLAQYDLQILISAAGLNTAPIVTGPSGLTLQRSSADI